jgi:hypothetical protein
MNEFGQLGKLHIVDLNKDALPFDQTFGNQVKDIDEALYKLEYLEN